MKLVFLGGGHFAVPALAELKKEFKIALVVTNPEKPVGRKQIPKPSAIELEAKKLGFPVETIEKIDENFIKKIQDINPLCFVIIDYGKILPQKLLDIPTKGAVNVHPSKLPKYRGASPLQSAILAGEKSTAISIMLIDDKMDHGPILMQKETAILPDDTYGSLYKRLSELYPNFLVESLKKYLLDEIKPVPQNDSLATFTKILNREDGKIDWLISAQKIEQMVRAYNPWPGTFTEFNNKNLKILNVSISKKDYQKNPGEIFKDEKLLIAKCGENSLVLERVQPEGKKPMSGEEFVRGYIK